MSAWLKNDGSYPGTVPLLSNPAIKLLRDMVIRYASGQVARVGDRVDYDGEPSIVEDVVEAGHILMTCDVVQNHGLMMTNGREGRVFEGVDSTCWGAIVLLHRKTD